MYTGPGPGGRARVQRASRPSVRSGVREPLPGLTTIITTIIIIMYMYVYSYKYKYNYKYNNYYFNEIRC